MSIKTINSYVHYFTTWFVVIGYGLKSAINYLPIDISKWLIDIPSLLVHFWAICFTLVFLTGGIYRSQNEACSDFTAFTHFRQFYSKC